MIMRGRGCPLRLSQPLVPIHFEGTLAASANYTLTYTGNNLTITAAALKYNRCQAARTPVPGRFFLFYPASHAFDQQRHPDRHRGLRSVTATATANQFRRWPESI
jgi:hypothetical protein